MTVKAGGGGQEWAGSNADVGTYAEVDEELRHRVVLQDDNLLRARDAEEQYREAMRAYLAAYAATIASCPSNWPTAKKEREAKMVNVDLRIAYEQAQLSWECAKLMVTAQTGLINATQSRGANLRAQSGLDGRAPSWTRPASRDPGDGDAQSRPSGTKCLLCNEPQFETPGGRSCKNGHGGAPAGPEASAPWVEAGYPVPEPVPQRQAPSSERRRKLF